MVIVVSGSSGLVGSALVRALEERDHLVRRLIRGEVRDSDREIRWDPAAGTIDAAELEGIDAVVHLAGENLAAKRWNDEVKRKIRDSRAKGTRLLSETLASLSSKPDTLVSASAIGFYGNRPDTPVDESSPPGDGFLAEVCQEWEAATEPARAAGMRVVNLRIGVVISGGGGALAKMLLPFKLGVGGVIGSGKQVWSWIALDDLVRAIMFALDNTSLNGPVNAVAPGAVTNREFTKTLGSVLSRPTIVPMPTFAARLALGEMADEMLLSGARVEPTQLQQAGFTFAYPQLEPALRSALGK